ncbi:DnaD domain protein [Lactobacillaceae bacterium Melli_B3]
MSNELTPTDPKIGFIVVKNERLSNLASESIDLLYQPIIGSTATTLVRLLWHWSQDGNEAFAQRPHYELFSFLQIDAPKFNECRNKLEGVGLLKTFVQKTDSKLVFIYQLVPPLSNRQFFDDDLLSLALLENVGEDLYKQLAQRLLIKPFPLNDAQEITQNFLDSFQIDADQITNQPNTIANLKHDYHLQQSVQGPTQSYDDLKSRDFDFELLLNCVDKSYVNVDQVKKYYQLIINEHLLFGIDEIEMAKVIIRATNIKNNVFSPEKLKMLISRMYQPSPRTSIDNQVTTDQSSLDENGFSKEERSLIEGAEHYAPLKFLSRLKKKRGGFASDDEVDLITELVDRHIMSTGAVNMLTYHILVDQEKPKLTKRFFDYIANDWAQKYHVQTAADAMNAIKEYNQSKQRSSYKQSNYHRKAKPKTPVQPSWLSGADDALDNEQVSDAERKKIEEMLKKFD